MESEPQFMISVDDNGNEYFTFNATTIKEVFRPKNVTGARDVCTFLSETIEITRKATGAFSRDLTTTIDGISRDDLILAFLSLVLLLVIEGILTTVLLRTYNGRVSNFSFSIKQFIELARDFKLRYLIRSRRKEGTQTGAPRKINFKLLIIATLILSFTFGVEVLVLYLSTPKDVAVKNDVASFTLVEVVIPDWIEVRKNIQLSTVRPCTAVTFSGVDQKENQLSACMASPTLSTSQSEFAVANENVSVIMTSDVHEFGAEHEVTIAGRSAKYVARAYVTLGDGKNRILRKRSQYFNNEKAVGLVHKQFIAYLFNYYNLQGLGDTSMTLERLEALDFKFTTLKTGRAVSIMEVRGRQRFRQVMSTTHVTNVAGIIPIGTEALRFAQAVLKGSTAIAVAGPDVNDLQMGSGNTAPREAVMWYETSRTLNWLSLVVLLSSAFLFFVILRWLLQPIGTAQIAGAFVREAVGADLERPPAMLADDEKAFFEIRFSETSSSMPMDTVRTNEGAGKSTAMSWRMSSDSSGFSDISGLT